MTFESPKAPIVAIVLVLLLGAMAFIPLGEAPVIDGEIAASADSSWKTFSSKDEKVSFLYPDPFPGNYVGANNWPPAASLNPEVFSCIENELGIAGSGATYQKVINGKTYCVHKESEGAAGVIYTTYSHTFEAGEDIAVLTTTIRLPNCMKYDVARQADCRNEQDLFDVDYLIHQITETLQVSR